jgi:hypothetical protein
LINLIKELHIDSNYLNLLTSGLIWYSKSILKECSWMCRDKKREEINLEIWNWLI